MLVQVPDAVRRWPTQARDRIRDRGPTAVVRAVRLTGAAVSAYVVAQGLLPSDQPVLAPLTALLVVQVTLFSTLTAGLRRIVSVVVGVVVAVLFADFVELTWWSLAILIAAAIIVGQLLRLREHLLEVPISAMLVLSIGGAEAQAAEARIIETLVGAAVGVLYNLLLPGPVQSRSAGEAVEQYAARIARLLRHMGDELAQGVSIERANDWLDEARTISRRVGRVDQALAEVEESRRLNVRALGTLDPGPVLRSGLNALEHSSVALRGLCRAVVDRIRNTEDGEKAYSREVREVFAVLLHDLAEAVSAFGRLVREEAEGEAQAQQLTGALDAVGEARVRLTELLLIERGDDDSWEPHGDLLSAVQRVLREIDVEERVRQRQRQQERQAARAPAVQAVDRLRTSSREVVHPVRRRLRRP